MLPFAQVLHRDGASAKFRRQDLLHFGQAVEPFHQTLAHFAIIEPMVEFSANRERQARDWQPWLDWAASRYDAPLRVTSGIVPIRQHRSSLAALRSVVAALDPAQLAALGIAVPAMDSLVLGLALAEGRLDAATAHALGALDELFQIEFWGDDAEAAARRASVAADIALAERFMALTRG